MLRHSRRQTLAIMCTLLALALLAQFSNAGGFRRRACQTNGIPNCDYQTNEIRQRATVASFVVPNIAAAAGQQSQGNQSPEKMFQPSEESLVVGDCYLTQIRLLVDSDGNFLLSYRAANSANSLDLAPPPGAVKVKAKGNDAARPIVPVRHHRFQITVRLYSGPEDPNLVDRKRAGGIVLSTRTIGPFNVTAGRELVVSKAGHFAGPQPLFNKATQAEFELEIDPPVTLPER